MKTTRWALGGALFLAVLGVPGTALAAGQATGGGAGCKANGQAVAAAAQAAHPFGRAVVKTSAPIADDVAAFKAALCGPPAG
jgi:hypothetical protein